MPHIATTDISLIHPFARSTLGRLTTDETEHTDRKGSDRFLSAISVSSVVKTSRVSARLKVRAVGGICGPPVGRHSKVDRLVSRHNKVEHSSPEIAPIAADVVLVIPPIGMRWHSRLPRLSEDKTAANSAAMSCVSPSGETESLQSDIGRTKQAVPAHVRTSARRIIDVRAG
jgi:hypothetical protein